MHHRTLSETVKTLKNQMTDLQSQMSLLTKQLDEERRSRLSLAATVKRSMGVIEEHAIVAIVQEKMFQSKFFVHFFHTY
jgi:hypothetical protein